MRLRFQGLNSHSISKEDITHTEDGWYKIQSQTNRGEYYSVNTYIGFCTCEGATNICESNGHDIEAL